MIIPLLDVTLQGLSDWSLSERDIDVLAFLGEEEFNFFTFEGLKRRLGLHPETLSRILDRLEAEGIVKKSSEDYTVTKEIAKHIKHHSGNSSESRAILLQTFLPSDLPVEQLVSNLRGRWFGLLRWLGLAENSENVTLKWVTQDGDIQVDAKITLNALSIEAKFLHGYNQNLALKAAYQLMTHIGKLSSRAHAPMARHVGYFGNQDSYFMPT
jgi:DNA-binding MarR family transcriptional regulator